MSRRVAFLVVLGVSIVFSGYAQSPDYMGCEEVPDTLNCKLIDDFESYALGDPPRKWRDTRGRELVRLSKEGVMTDRKNVYVRSENGNQFARIYTDNKALRVVMSRKNGLNWSLDKRPILQWKWRAKALPKGANEKDKGRNDTGGAVYVTFDTDWLGRPKSIKYTYSSTLPVGTTADYGPLKVLVVASKKEQGAGRWIRHERNVIADYRELFGETPDKTPSGIAIWSDSDTMNETATIDFDDILVLSGSMDGQSTAESSK